MTNLYRMSLAVFRRPDLSRAEFLDYWLNVHGPLVRSLAADIRAVRYVQLHGDHGELSQRYEAQRGVAAVHDGVAQMWWRSEADRLDGAATEAGQAATRLLVEDEHRFCDLARSTVCFGYDHVVIGNPVDYR